jgi:hypothetical protein
MPNEPESRLRALFAQLPTATKTVEDRALAAALAALPPPTARHARPVRTALLVAAAAMSVLVVSAVALGAAGALHVRLGAPAALPPRAVATPRLALPRGARGIAAVVGGRLWFTSRSGLRIEGLPVSSAALSPHARYVAAGVGDSLVVMAPGGTRAWSHAAGGRVVAIAWAPSGLRIAYVVRKATGGEQLRTIEGDGDHDRLLDAAVRSVAPSWRADALAVAYVGAGGHPVVYDFARRAHHVIGNDRPADVTTLAFAPRGRVLAVVGGGRIWILDAHRTSVGDLGRRAVAGIAWVGDRVGVALGPPAATRLALSIVQSFRTSPSGALSREKPVLVRGRVTALGSLGNRFVFALRPVGTHTGLIASVGESGRVLFDAGPRSTVGELAVR